MAKVCNDEGAAEKPLSLKVEKERRCEDRSKTVSERLQIIEKLLWDLWRRAFGSP